MNPNNVFKLKPQAATETLKPWHETHLRELGLPRTGSNTSNTELAAPSQPYQPS